MRFEMTARVNLNDEKIITLVIDLIEDTLKEEMDCEIIDFSTLDKFYRNRLIYRCVSEEIESLFAEPVFNDYLDDIELSFNDDITELEDVHGYYFNMVLNKIKEMCE